LIKILAGGMAVSGILKRSNKKAHALEDTVGE
jgi:hypothetical protein